MFMQHNFLSQRYVHICERSHKISVAITTVNPVQDLSFFSTAQAVQNLQCVIGSLSDPPASQEEAWQRFKQHMWAGHQLSW